MDPRTPEPNTITSLRRGRLWRRSPPSPRPPKHPSTPSPSPSSASTPALDSPNPNPNPNSFFFCNICLDSAKDPVVTHCGHLFCWRCLYQWVHCHSPARDCPVCKSSVHVESGNLTVVPIYGPDSAGPPATHDDVPPRPAGRRSDRGSVVSNVIEEVRQTAEMIGARVQLQALRRTTWAIDRVLGSLQAIEDLVERLRVIHQEMRGPGDDARRREADVEEDGIYRRTRRRLAEQ